ncbi:MAG TPA: UDP-3-O-(3-hydroxymyristoyl)glucosamine N-acyltransferase [Gammaproteobacteria bacterium]|nr:UDP-3-O-(3-hydroxymyristoyl)glucosamine N-acyltransferase [Gammaproteobacteria bacterium]|tara:strand:+ start:464 stop:1441 length:978 start_codon:yes stop_codon:yes gene_type:complete
MAYSVALIANEFSLEYEGDGELKITGLCGISDNLSDHLSYVASKNLANVAAASKIRAFVTRPDIPIENKTNLFHDDPNFAIAKIAKLFTKPASSQRTNIHKNAVIDPTATIEKSAIIHANVTVGANSTIGDGSIISAGCVISDDVQIGADCLLHPNCVVRESSVIGDRVILQPGVVIGGDGFGYVRYENEHIKVPQLGNVVIEADVEIGANSSIDRARFTSTKIKQGSKLDNGVMVAHNVEIGERCILVAQCGISGSSRLGDDVVLAGQTGLVGHIEITNGVTVLGQSMVTKNIRDPGVWGGSPARPAKLWKRALARLYSGLDRT